MALSEKSFADELRVEGITFKGYGTIPKVVTLDSTLSIEAKAIYAYFASYSGGGSCAFPSRDKILSDLKISKDRYYKHLKMLQDRGFICLQKETGQGFQRNVYILKSAHSSGKEPADIVSMSGINEAGYGIMPKAVTTDDRLPIEAKGLYAYYAAFTGSGRECTPEVKTICYHLDISSKRYLRYRNILEDLGYVSISRIHKDGLLSSVKVTLLENPDFLSKGERTVTVIKSDDQWVQNKDTRETVEPQGFNATLVHQRVQNKDIQNHQWVQNQDVQNQDVQNQDVQNQDVQNKDTNNNSINNNNFNNNNIKREAEKEKAAMTERFPLPPYFFKCPAGELSISQDEKDKLADAFDNVEGLLELAVCCLSQRKTMPRSTFHYIWELAIEKGWKRVSVKKGGSKEKAVSEEDKLIKKWEEEDRAAYEEKVRAFMMEKGLSDFAEAEEEYTARVEEEAREKLKAFLKR